MLFYVFLCCCMYCLFCVVLCIVCVYMCTELLPSGGYPIASKTRKDGPRPALFLIFVLFCVFFVLFYVFLCCSMYCLFCVVLCIVCVYMCTVLLPAGGYPIASKTRKDGTRPALFLIFVLFYVFFVLFYVLFVLCRSLYCLRVYVYCTTATRWLPNCS